MSHHPLSCIADDVTLGRDVILNAFTNLYGCSIGDQTKIGTFVEVQGGAVIGCRCKISSHSFICSGVTLEDECFIGHGVMFINDRFPRATDGNGRMLGPLDWKMERIEVGRGAAIGSGAVILGGVRIGAGALVGAGAVVTRDVPARSTVVGVPARLQHGVRGVWAAHAARDAASETEAVAANTPSSFERLRYTGGEPLASLAAAVACANADRERGAR